MEFIFEFIAEIILTPVIDGVMGFLNKIIPQEKLHKNIVWAVKIIFGFIIVSAIIAFFIGLIAYIGAESVADKKIGKGLLIFSLITFAIFTVIRIFSPDKNKTET